MNDDNINPVVEKIKNIFRKYFSFSFSLLFSLAYSNYLGSQTINLYAGSFGSPGYSGDGGPAISAKLNYPKGTVSDKQGNLFIADGNNHVVRKVSPSGIISTVAGDGTFGYSGDGGPATSAKLWFPYAVAIDTSGNLYILEFDNSVVRKVNKEGIINTVAGNGTNGYSGDGGPATLAQLNNPTDVAIDKAGNIYIAEKYNKVVRKVSTSGIISTIAGNGISGYNGDGGPAIAAQLTSPNAVAVDNAGNIYIADNQNAVIRKVSTSGIISTFAGNGTYGYSGDGGLASLAQFASNSPIDIAVDNQDNVYVADYGNHVIRKINISGIITTVAGIGRQSGSSGDGGLATSAELWFPTAISVDSCNNFYITDSYDSRIRKVSSGEAAIVNGGPVNISVCDNDKASFGIRASRANNFQWMMNTGAGWINVEENEIYSGTNTDTLRVSKAITSMDGYHYFCMVSNSCGPVYSTIATLSVKAAILPAITITASDTIICAGSNVIFSASTLNAEANSVYQWKKNGINVGINAPSYSDTTLKNGDVITCTVTSNNNCLADNTTLSNTIIITVHAVLSPSVTITAVSSDTICPNTPVTFLASAANAGSNPVFQWKKNGNNIETNNLSFTSDQFSDGDVVTCTLINNDACAAISQITSNSITISLKQDTIPKVTIVASSGTICAGTSVTFTAINENKNQSPVYQWVVDGKEKGSNNAVYVTNTLTGNPLVQCIMKVPQCAGTAEVYSNPIKLTVNSPLNPSVNITSSSPDNTCKGTPVTFVATAEQAGTAPFYQWQINGNNVGTDSDRFTTSVLNDGDIITCVLSADPSVKCLQNSFAISKAITVKIRTPVNTSVNVFPSANDICGSKPITFTSYVQNTSNETSYQWLLNGNNTGTDSIAYTNIAPVDNDHVQLIVTTAIPGCSLIVRDTSNTVTVSIKSIPNILLSPLDTNVMIGTQVQLLAAVTGNIASFSWTPADALISSQTLSPLTIPIESATKFKLTVESTNGCIANKESNIKVNVKLYMPNSFTPNGDGRNDLFRIPPGTSIILKEFSIYNRWGMKIFSTSDISKGWDGRYKSSLVDAGLYLFIIHASDYQNQNILLKGSVLVIR